MRILHAKWDLKGKVVMLSFSTLVQYRNIWQIRFPGSRDRIHVGNESESIEFLHNAAMLPLHWIGPRGKKKQCKKKMGFFYLKNPPKQQEIQCFFKEHDTQTQQLCVCVMMSGSAPLCHKMMGAIRIIRQSVSLATLTYPSPPTLVILRRKSTELRLGGFHLRMSSHLPGLYLCRDRPYQMICNVDYLCAINPNYAAFIKRGLCFASIHEWIYISVAA